MSSPPLQHPDVEKADVVLTFAALGPFIWFGMLVGAKGLLFSVNGLRFAANHGHATITLVGGVLLIAWVTNIVTPQVGSMGEIDE